jgi:type VI secretion system protein ImpE
MSAYESLLSGDLGSALTALFDEVRNEPEQPRHRIFLFQLLSIVGEWDRALTQLNVARDLDPTAGVMAQAYQEILQCEALRRQVFDGLRTPLIFGDPEPWLAQLVEAMRLAGEGQADAAYELRQQALQEAPASAGHLSVRIPSGSTPGETGGEEDAVDEVGFEWLADGDTRMGPVLEMIVNGRYYWAPLHRISEIVIEPPSDLRDLVWTPAQFRWANEGEAVGVIPTRYVGSEANEEDAIRLARKTCWDQTGPDAYEGLGQRVFMTDLGEYGLLDIRRITLGASSDVGG